MFKNLSPTVKLFSGLIVGVLVIVIIMIAASGNKAPKQAAAHYINDNASADNKVEALKTMTADLLSVENNNKQLKQNVESLKTQNKTSVDHLKQSITSQVQVALKKIAMQNTQNEQKQIMLETKLKQKERNQTQGYPVNGHSNNNGAFVWVSDLSKLTDQKRQKTY